MTFLRFVRELLRVVFHEARFRYYRAAHRFVGDTHPDSWLISRRMVQSQIVVNDFLRGRL